MRKAVLPLSLVLWALVGAVALAQSGFFLQAQTCMPTEAANFSNVPTATVAGLPACTALIDGQIYKVTNALLPSILGIVVGGGAVTVLVHCKNGTGWVAG